MAPLRPVVLFSGMANSRELCDVLRLVNVYAYDVAATKPTHDDAPSAQLVDRHGDFARLYGLRRGFLCLIRPDGHVGLVQIPPDREHLLNYLSLVCEQSSLQGAFA